MFPTIRYRLFLANFLVFTLVLLGSGFVVRLVFVRNLRQQSSDRLITVAQAAAASVDFDKGYLESETKFSQKLLSDRALGFQWFDAQGHLIEQQGDRLYLATLPLSAEKTVEIQTSEIELQIVTLPIINSIDREIIGYIRVSQSLAEVNNAIARLDKGLVAGGLVALVLSSLGSGWLNLQAMQPIEASFQRLKQFTADASHELRNPLMAISTNAEIALTYTEGMRTRDAEKFQAIALATEQMSRLTEDLLLLARSDNISDFESHQIDLTRLLLNLVGLYKSQAESLKIELKVNIASNLALMGDENKLTRAVTNLIQNALQYTPAGGKVNLTATRPGREIAISVRDTGIGIAPENLERVFERLWRADNSRSYHQGGSGLGLAITKAIIDRHRGTIIVTSKLNVGSCFVVRLPVAES